MENLKRDKGIKTKNGMIFYSKDKKMWQIDFPDMKYRYGGAPYERVAIFFLLLGKGHSLKNARDIAFEKTKLRKRTK